jgi:tryptophan synthase alpha subunit
LLVVDLPLSEFKPYYPSDLHHLQFVFIVSQNCDLQYLHDVTEQSYGSVLYIMTTLATTGSGKSYDFTIIDQLKQLKSKTLIA